jgi:hypothetical protein
VGDDAKPSPAGASAVRRIVLIEMRAGTVAADNGDRRQVRDGFPSRLQSFFGPKPRFIKRLHHEHEVKSRIVHGVCCIGVDVERIQPSSDSFGASTESSREFVALLLACFFLNVDADDVIANPLLLSHGNQVTQAGWHFIGIDCDFWTILGVKAVLLLHLFGRENLSDSHRAPAGAYQ